MKEATRMLHLTEAAQANEYNQDYKAALHQIEEAARSGKGHMSIEYDDDSVRKGVSALLKVEGFHTCRIGESRLFIRWDQ